MIIPGPRCYGQNYGWMELARDDLRVCNGKHLLICTRTYLHLPARGIVRSRRRTVAAGKQATKDDLQVHPRRTHR